VNGSPGMVIGFAQFPGGADSTDGVVIKYDYMGTIGAAANSQNAGRTATHEVGHWLNLRHIWGDATCGNDQVTDTPTQQTSNFGCPSFPKVTCSNGPNGDMFMNYMDYTDDACMYMFTNGQKARMIAAVNTSRPGLLTSQGCVPPSGGSSCGTPTSLATSSILQTSATVTWAAVSGALSYNIQYRVSGTTAWTTTTSTTTSNNITGLVASTIYQYQVQAVCSAATSTYSSIATFTTVSPACSDAYESNNTRNTAKTIAVNTDISANIGSGTDKDWFRFSTVAGATNIKAVLDLLPADYDLRLYNSAGSQLAISQLGGTSTETIIRNTATAATYFVQVYPYSSTGFNANVCYRLRINAAGSTFRDGVGTEYTEGNINPAKMEAIDGISLYPNPTSDVINLSFFQEYDGTIFTEVVDIMGKVVYSGNFGAVEGFNKTEISTSNMSNGIYFLRIVQDEMSIVRKFVVKH